MKLIFFSHVLFIHSFNFIVHKVDSAKKSMWINGFGSSTINIVTVWWLRVINEPHIERLEKSSSFHFVYCIYFCEGKRRKDRKKVTFFLFVRKIENSIKLCDNSEREKKKSFFILNSSIEFFFFPFFFLFYFTSFAFDLPLFPFGASFARVRWQGLILFATIFFPYFFAFFGWKDEKRTQKRLNKKSIILVWLRQQSKRRLWLWPLP